MSDYRWLRYGYVHPRTGKKAAQYLKERFEERQKARNQGPAAVPGEPTVESIVDPEKLINIFHRLRKVAGQAPGPDGITYALLGRRTVPYLMRELSDAVCQGQYQPAPGVKVPIPKLGGGTRTLTIRSIFFRVLSSALKEALEPLWEEKFLPMSMGFRPKRGPLLLLAELEKTMVEQDRWVLALDDVYKAFDCVSIDDVLADHRKYIESNSLLSLIEVVLRGGENKERGIDQGSAYNPLALNIRLHHAHDLHLGEHDPPCWRYADNLTYLCSTVAEGTQILARANQLLANAGHSLKGKDGIKDLHQGEHAHLLGFALSREEDHLHLSLGGKAWIKLQEDLVRAHESTNPPLIARAILRGWINGYGPAFESKQKVYRGRILTMTARHGFREVSSPRELTDWLRASHARWLALRQGVWTGSARTPSAPPAPLPEKPTACQHAANGILVMP